MASAYQLNEEYSLGETYIRKAIELAESIPCFDSKKKSTYYALLKDLRQAQKVQAAWEFESKN